MSQRYNQKPVVSGETHFTKSAVPDLEFSKFTSVHQNILTMNAGDIVPIYCGEVLPHDTWEQHLDGIIRQSTALVPTMGEMLVDYIACFVPHRVVNRAIKNVFGENTSGQWIAPEVSLAPLVSANDERESIQVPVGSVADYYGFPTQAPIPVEVLQQCHDLKFRGYLACYNYYFRDQNYQPPIPFSDLNIYNGFFELRSKQIRIDGPMLENSVTLEHIGTNVAADGSYPKGSVVEAIGGPGSKLESMIGTRMTRFSALDKPLKANKLHDLFTSVTPSPQKGQDVIFGIGDEAPVNITSTVAASTSLPNGLRFQFSTANGLTTSTYRPLGAVLSGGTTAEIKAVGSATDIGVSPLSIIATNLAAAADLSNATGISVEDLRTAATVQHVYEILATGGSRYTEFIDSFFGLDTVNNFPDYPQLIGKSRRKLDLYQVAQTSSNADTPQGNLAAFGYTVTDDQLFTRTFLEHGYVHVFAVIRHKNLYSTYLSRDNFRMSMLDFYNPMLANLGNQPVYTREINPFLEDTDGVFGYAEAWYDYRMEPDRTAGYMRSGIEMSLDQWNFADPFIPDLEFAEGDWLKSNSQEVLDRTLAVTSVDDDGNHNQHQFNCQFVFKTTKERPMPAYSIPGIDII